MFALLQKEDLAGRRKTAARFDSRDADRTGPILRPSMMTLGGQIMHDRFLAWVTHGEKTRLSEILSKVPSDEELAELFPGRGRCKPPFDHINLEILRLEIEGWTSREIAERLDLTLPQTTDRAKNVRLRLARVPMPDYLDIDVPAVRRLRGMEIPRPASSYEKISDLLREMPSDQQLLQIYRDMGFILGYGKKHYLSHEDLVLLKNYASGQQETAIAKELGITKERVRQRLVQIRGAAVRDLRIDNDLPEIFPSHD